MYDLNLDCRCLTRGFQEGERDMGPRGESEGPDCSSLKLVKPQGRSTKKRSLHHQWQCVAESVSSGTF